ncbi:toxin-antitoxin system HicB family antitoxin [Nocardioides sp. SOB77]|uniref:Toxin-antitoxin system HicB family antitoxin n=1 Tax=Nocardioides oceani TaxID=3058369 RepID=A0ABT8FFL5_9ACTN|nr:toxin-antitoxin system HicB family antitoxin [Nocardioides oceani]MDN4173399.1 toxin-antitoxin system HicB family antitoxin [Nocardioides oceani]
MDITPYVDSLRRDLLAAAEAAGPEARQAAERLAFALDPAARLALMEAVSQAAAEITAEMPAGGVDVRLNGRDLDFVVDAAPTPPTPPTPLAPPAPPAPPAGPGAEAEPEDDSVARITLRLPESVKARAEELAARSGQSLNTWLVGVVRGATREGSISVDIDLSSIPFLGGGDPLGRRGNRRMNGWL